MSLYNYLIEFGHLLQMAELDAETPDLLLDLLDLYLLGLDDLLQKSHDHPGKHFLLGLLLVLALLHGLNNVVVYGHLGHLLVEDEPLHGLKGLLGNLHINEFVVEVLNYFLALDELEYCVGHVGVEGEERGELVDEVLGVGEDQGYLGREKLFKEGFLGFGQCHCLSAGVEFQELSREIVLHIANTS